MDGLQRFGALIVDDEPDIRMLMRVLIEAHGDGLYVSGEARDGTEALACIDQMDPAVVVLDQMMPGMDGLQTARGIRRLRPFQPMILCSAHLDDRLERDASAVGIAVCLPKTMVSLLPATVRRLASPATPATPAEAPA